MFEEFSGWFNGKTSPVHLFWHGLDLAVTRFSGRPGVPIDADPVTQEAYSQEVISFGFWAGDDNVGDAAYYSYTAPEPEGLRDQPLSAGEWIEFGAGSLAILPYETVRTARDPRQGTARVLPERLRGRCSPRRLGHRRLRVDLVPQPGATPTAPRRAPPPPSGERRRTRSTRMTDVFVPGAVRTPAGRKPKRSFQRIR